MIDIAPVSGPDFNAEASVENDILNVALIGNADLNVKDILDGFLRKVHTEAQRLELHDVEVDVRRLEFMNSSCLKCLVAWISRIQDSPIPRQYRVSFRSSPALFWQKRSLQALSYLAADLVSVQT